MKFPCKKVIDNNEPEGYIKLPMIRVRLFYEGKYDDVRCLLDTGADVCLFHASVAENLGIDFASGKPRTMYGVGEQPFQAYMHTIELRIHGSSERIRFEAGFTKACKFSLLGQKGFFDSYEVTFRRFKGEIEIKRRPRHH